MKNIPKKNKNNFSLNLLLIVFLLFVAAFINFFDSKPKNNDNENVEGISIDNSNFSKQTIYLSDYFQTGDADYTQAIVRANAKLKSTGGGILIFPSGSYKIRPNQIFIPSNVKWQGQGTARIYTQETSLYNVLVSTENGSKNIEIDNITFDQRDDVAQTPTVAGPVTGAFLLHISNTDNIIVRNSTFYTYGVCAVLAQSNYTSPTNTIGIYDNKAYFQRKTDTTYDVSVFNIDGKNVYVENNYIEGIEVSSFKDWKPRTAYEVHMPNGIINNNTSKNTATGILPVAWPALWNTYEPSFIGKVEITNNKIEKAIIGIDIWNGGYPYDINTKNFTIKNNNINLHLDDKYVPAYGIGFYPGSPTNGIIDNILIDSNVINMTVSPVITSVNSRMNYLIGGENVGAILANTKSTITNLTISNNTVTNFPYSFLNLYRRNDTGGTLIHSTVKVFNNTVTDCSYAYTYKDVFEAIFNAGRSNNVSVYSNTVTNPTRKPIAVLNKLDLLTNFSYSETGSISNPTTAPTTIPTVKPITTAPTTIPTVKPTTSTARIYTGVIGTWANSKQIYVTNREQCLAGDMIITPNGEKSIIRTSKGNYIYLVTDVQTWYGGKTISLYSSNNPIPTLIPTSTPIPTPTFIPTPTPTPIPTSIPTPTPISITVKPTATPTPISTGTTVAVDTGYKAEAWNYSRGWFIGIPSYRSPVVTTQISAINFNWGAGSPVAKINKDKFIARFTGTKSFEAGKYQFTTTSDDGVRLWVDDQLIINQWTRHSAQMDTASLDLTAGTHKIRLEYFEYQGNALIRMGIKKI